MATLKPTDKELKVREELEQEIRKELSRRKWGADELADQLGMAASGTMMLLDQKLWSLETAFRLAELLGMELEIKTKSSS